MTRLSINVLRVCCAGWLAIPVFSDTKLYAADKVGHTIKQAEDGSVKMGAADAKIQGPNARLEGGEVKDIMWWTSADTVLHWTARVQKPARYRVELTYAIVGNNNGSPLSIVVGDQIVNATPKAGSGLNDLKTAKAGEVTISKAGDLDVVIKPLLKDHEYVINVRSLALLPADTPTEAINISSGAIHQAEDGSFTLTASDAQIDGMNAVLIGVGADDKKVGYWKDIGTSLVWTIDAQKPGKYRVELNYSQIKRDEGAKVVIVVDDQKVKARPTSGESWQDVKTGLVGEVTISKTGHLQVAAIPVSKPSAYVMDLFSLVLHPVETASDAPDIHDEPIKQLEDGSVHLTATDAEIDGEAIRLEGGDNKYLAWWSHGERLIQWPIKIDAPGTFRVEVTYSLADSISTEQVQISGPGQKITASLPPTASVSSIISLKVAGQTITDTLQAGLGWDDFKTENLGEVTLPMGDNHELILSSPKTAGTLVMRLQSVTLIPVADD